MSNGFWIMLALLWAGAIIYHIGKDVAKHEAEERERYSDLGPIFPETGKTDAAKAADAALTKKREADKRREQYRDLSKLDLRGK